MKLIWAVVLVLAGVAVYAGLQIQVWFTTRTDVRVLLEELCTDNEACTAAVEATYVECFGGAFSHDWKPEEATLDVASLTACVNDAAPGEPFVALEVYERLEKTNLQCRLIDPDHLDIGP
jgi:hypothetical protein